MIADAGTLEASRAPAATAARAGRVVAVALPLVVIAARNGGYFPTSWGWSALFFGWTAVMALVLARDAATTRAGAGFAAGLAAFGGWILLSATWSDSQPASVLEGERAFVYVAAVATLLVLARRLGAATIAAGLLVAIAAVSAYALATRVFPERLGRFDPIAGYRLADPVGYWNALGLFAAIGALLALGFATRAPSRAARAAASASLVLLVPTIFFTFSRGSWLALAVALLALVALDVNRLQLIAAAAIASIAPAVAVLVAWRSPALTTLGSNLDTATRQGHRLAWVIVGMVAAAILLALLLDRAEQRVRATATIRHAFAAALAALVLAVAAVAVATWGSPWHMAARGWHAFTAAPPQTGENLNNRLFHLSGTGRIDSWRSAIHEWKTAPAAGTGAGTFEAWWDGHRSKPQQIRDAHSLYLETLGELGLVGLLLLVGTLLVPLAAAIRARREPYVPFLAAAFVAWLVHAGVDWDWEIPAVTLPALACAAAICAASPGRALALGTRTRIGIGAAAAAIAGFGLVAGIGNQALASSQNALDSQNYAKAETNAEKAARWAPWLADPWIIEGELAGLDRDEATAARDFRKAIAEDPRSYLAWYGLAGATTGGARQRAVDEVVRLNPLSDEAKELRTGS